jgi:hypothetical protein
MNEEDHSISEQHDVYMGVIGQGDDVLCEFMKR